MKAYQQKVKSMERNKGKIRTIRYGCWWVKKTILPKCFGNSSNCFCSALASVTKKVCLEKCKSSTCVSAYSATQESKTYWYPWNFEENNRKSCSFSNTGRVYFVILIVGGELKSADKGNKRGSHSYDNICNCNQVTPQN